MFAYALVVVDVETIYLDRSDRSWILGTKSNILWLKLIEKRTEQLPNVAISSSHLIVVSTIWDLDTRKYVMSISFVDDISFLQFEATKPFDITQYTLKYIQFSLYF